MLRKCIVMLLCLSVFASTPKDSFAGQVSIADGYVTLPAGGGIVFSGGAILNDPTGITGPMGPMGPVGPVGPVGPAGVTNVMVNEVVVGPVAFGAGQTVNLASMDVNLQGNKKILILVNISSLSFQGSPPAYGGKNHSLHVNVTWNIIADGNEMQSTWQNAEQNIITFQTVGGPTPAGMKTITLQAVNSSYWRLDDSPYGTTPVGSEFMRIVISAMEI